ncbi:unnamed protein product, partial [Symbiodinium pilosum]
EAASSLRLALATALAGRRSDPVPEKEPDYSPAGKEELADADVPMPDAAEAEAPGEPQAKAVAVAKAKAAAAKAKAGAVKQELIGDFIARTVKAKSGPAQPPPRSSEDETLTGAFNVSGPGSEAGPINTGE